LASAAIANSATGIIDFCSDTTATVTAAVRRTRTGLDAGVSEGAKRGDHRRQNDKAVGKAAGAQMQAIGPAWIFSQAQKR